MAKSFEWGAMIRAGIPITIVVDAADAAAADAAAADAAANAVDTASDWARDEATFSGGVA